MSFLFVIYVLTELMLLVLNNQIVNVGRGLGRMCDLGVIFFLNQWKFSKRKWCFLKTSHNCSSQSPALPEDELLSCWTTTDCMWRKRAVEHQNHWMKSEREGRSRVN